MNDLLRTVLNVTKKKKLFVISLVGMGGVGKSALAKVIFNDVIVQKHFQFASWHSISDDVSKFDPSKMASDVADSHDAFDTPYTVRVTQLMFPKV